MRWRLGDFWTYAVLSVEVPSDPSVRAAFVGWDQVLAGVESGDVAALRVVVAVLRAAPTPELRMIHGPGLVGDLLAVSPKGVRELAASVAAEDADFAEVWACVEL